MTSFWHSDPNISTLNTSSSCTHNPPETFEMSAVSTNWQYEPPTGSEPGSNNTLDEDQRNHRLPLGVKLTGYRLLNMTIILVFGIWKAVASYRGESIVETTLDWVGGALMAFILYYVGLFQEDRPLFFPQFFKVDWAPHILKFVWRSEVYIFLLSLLPLWRAVAHLQYTLDVRHANPGYQVKVLDFPILQDALAIAILKLIISFIGTLRPVVNVLCNPQALQRFLDGDHGFILNGPPFFVLFICATFAQARMYQPATTYVHDQAFLVAIFSSLLLWPHMEEFSQIIRVSKGFLAVLLMFGVVRNPYNHYPQDLLFVCGMIIFFLYRFLTTLPTSWCSTVANMCMVSLATVYSAVRSAGRMAWDYVSRIVHSL